MASTTNGIKTLVQLYPKRFASDAPVNDKFLGINLRTITLNRSPSSAELHHFLRLTPNTFVRLSSITIVNKLLVIKLRIVTEGFGMNNAANITTSICDGLRQICRSRG